MQNKRVLHPFAAQEGKSLPGGLFISSPFEGGGGLFEREGFI